MSLEHLALLREHQPAGNGTKTLYQRAAGKFYTPEVVGRELAASALRYAEVHDGSPVRLVDPFCGDGRLVRWLLEEAAAHSHLAHREWAIELWDCDEAAVAAAAGTVARAAREAGIDAVVRPHVGDTFDEAPGRFGEFDIVVTNPPWEVLKPDRRELELLEASKAEQLVEHIRLHATRLAERYRVSMPRWTFSGWGVNLARVGVEVALRLTRPTGVAAVVSPATLIADQASEALRAWMFREFSVKEVGDYPAEARLFDGVDQPVITFLATRGGGDVNVAVTSHTRERVARPAWTFIATLRDLASSGYVLPVQFGQAAASILRRLVAHPSFADLEDLGPAGLWAGRELDETGHAAFLTSAGTNLFVKGRMVTRYRVVEAPTMYVIAGMRRIPASVSFDRIAWRDVSRPTQRRRVQATVIPAGWVTGNSLNVAYFRDGGRQRLLALLGVMNSSIFEIQARAQLATAHISLGTVRRCRVPLLDAPTVRAIAPLAERRLAGDIAADRLLDELVSQLYGLKEGLAEIEGILSGPSEGATADRDDRRSPSWPA